MTDGNVIHELELEGRNVVGHRRQPMMSRPLQTTFPSINLVVS
jgi:hypothetical protein